MCSLPHVPQQIQVNGEILSIPIEAEIGLAHHFYSYQFWGHSHQDWKLKNDFKKANAN